MSADRAELRVYSSGLPHSLPQMYSLTGLTANRCGDGLESS